MTFLNEKNIYSNSNGNKDKSPKIDMDKFRNKIGITQKNVSYVKKIKEDKDFQIFKNYDVVQ